MKKTILKMTVFLMALCLLTACSKDSDNNDGNGTTAGEHTYNIEVEGGTVFSGSVPKETGGYYYPVAFVEYDDDLGSDLLAGILQDAAGDFQFGLGLALDSNNQPTIPDTGIGLTFGQRNSQDKYGPAGPIELTLSNYEETILSMYGEEARVASFTLQFSGLFKLGQSGDPVNVTGEIVVAKP